MKKEYVHPQVMTITCMGKGFILGSQGVTGNNGIGYGGLDDGTHDPAAKEFKSIDLWDEEDEE